MGLETHPHRRTARRPNDPAERETPGSKAQPQTRGSRMNSSHVATERCATTHPFAPPSRYGRTTKAHYQNCHAGDDGDTRAAAAVRLRRCFAAWRLLQTECIPARLPMSFDVRQNISLKAAGWLAAQEELASPAPSVYRITRRMTPTAPEHFSTISSRSIGRQFADEANLFDTRRLISR